MELSFQAPPLSDSYGTLGNMDKNTFCWIMGKVTVGGGVGEWGAVGLWQTHVSTERCWRLEDWPASETLPGWGVFGPGPQLCPKAALLGAEREMELIASP